MAHAATSELQSILNKPLQGGTLSKSEILTLLGLQDPAHHRQLFRAARQLRDSVFAGRTYLYGFIYLSTYCRNDCTFCSFRRSNQRCKRYRKNSQGMLEAARLLFDSGVQLIDLTMGEDPYILEGSGISNLLDCIRSIREDTGAEIMISPGVASCGLLEEFKRSGVSWYACYQETHNRQLFAGLRPKQDYDARLNAKRSAKRVGLLVEEGLLCGVGERIQDIAGSIEVMKDLDADQVRVMTFVPQEGTPLGGRPVPGFQRELLTIAVLRLVFPDRLIPASLDVDGLRGLRQRLDAGANVVTSIVPPGQGLSGVAQESLDIEEGKRMVADVEKVLAGCNLQAASMSEYNLWIKSRRQSLLPN